MTDSSPPAPPSITLQTAPEAEPRSLTRSFTIGRAPGNDIVLDDEKVSQQHCAVLLDAGRWHLQDLGSSNGTFVNGKPGDRWTLTGTVTVRLGHDGPTLTLTVEGAPGHARPTVVSPPTPSVIVDRFLGRETPAEMSEHTALLRRVLRTEHRRRAKRYVWLIAMLAVVAIGASAFVYVQRKQLQRARAAAADLFYAMKSLELDVSRLRLDAEEMESYRTRREEMRQLYMSYLEELGIYSDNTPQDIQVIYRVVHRLGESEVNVPRAFVDEIQRYIERWRQSGRLEEAIARAREGNYAQTVADIMLQHDLPPEFFYLALQESGFRPEAVGRETRFGIAKGMWQFMPATARAYGLHTGPLVGVRRYDPRDERHVFEESTRAAAEYLRDIYTTDAQASGLLVMASYNWGQTNVLRLIRSMPENPQERNFWRLLTEYRDRIPQETYHYVFSIVSAAVIGENPALFGFDFAPPLEREEVRADG